MSLILGLFGAFLGSGFGSTWAQIGWMIGSTVGSLMAAEDLHTTTQGPRVTDFKTLNSKYGIAIQHGYGTARFASNVIWSGPVTEIENPDTNCVKVGGLFGLFEKDQCQTLVTFHYFQSAAYAFAEGPASGFVRLWADGEVVYYNSITNTGVVTNVEQDLANNPFGNNFSSPFTFYLGTQDQGIDPNIVQYLNPSISDSGLDETYAFRNIVYLMVNSLNLEPFGFRMPVINAEIAFNPDSVPVLASIPIPAPTVGDGSFESIGIVHGQPGLVVGADSSTGSHVIYDTVSQTYVSQLAGGGDGWPIYIVTTPDFRTLRELPSNPNIVGPANFSVSQADEAYSYFIDLSLDATTNADFGGALNYVLYNSAQDVLCASYAGGGAGCWPMVDPSVPTDGSDLIAGELFGKNVWVPVPGSGASDNYFYQHFSNGGGTNDPAKEIFLDENGNLWWLVSGAGGVFINFVEPNGRQDWWRVRFADGTPIPAASNWTFVPGTKDFIIAVSSAGTDAAGTYKLPFATLEAAAETNVVNLPASTDLVSYNAATPDDIYAFQQGPLTNELCFIDGGDVRCIDVYAMTDSVIVAPPGGVGVGSQAIPSLGGVQANDTSIVVSRFDAEGELLSDVVTDLMTVIDGDPRKRLTPDDIDVTDLALDTVRGYPLLQQQTIRNAILVLQQAYFFDAVETEGKIKFVKRGKSSGFNIPEDHLAAHEFGKTSSQTLVPVEWSLQSEIEMPREIAVTYTGFDNEYNQSTQRTRRQQTESSTNVTKTLPLVLSDDEAAQISDILLNNVWMERYAPFKLKTGPYYLDKEVTDVFTVTMNDGVVHLLRAVEFNIGANGACEIVAVRENVSQYVSAAVGIGALIPPSTIAVRQVQTFVVDIPAGFISSFSATTGQNGVIAGLSVFGIPGSNFPGGSLSTTGSGGASFGGTSNDPVSFGVTGASFGAPGAPLATGQFDYDTVITGTLQGGPIPTSCTEPQALTTTPACLVIIGQEIIAFTNISVVGSNFTLSGGLLRGLFGTENSQFHAAGSRVLFAENLFFVATNSNAGSPITATGTPTGGGIATTAIASFDAQNLAPRAPIDVEGAENGLDFLVQWVRQDRSQGSGIPPTPATTNSEVNNQFRIEIMDAENPGNELQVLRTEDVFGANFSSTNIEFIYTDVAQIADFGAQRVAPILVRIYQISDVIGPGFVNQTIVDRLSNYTPAGFDFTALPALTSRWGGTGILAGGGAISANTLEVSTPVDGEWGAVTFTDSGPALNHEVYTVLEIPNGGLAQIQGGVVLRGQRVDQTDLSGFLIGLGGTGNDLFAIKSITSGAASSPATEYIDSVTFNWVPGTRYSVRARVFNNRVQAKVWPHGGAEPGPWMLDAYGSSQSPAYGFGGVFAYHAANPPRYHYYSWAHRGLTALI